MGDRRLHLHFIWMGSALPYHCRLAVESAVVAMPDAVVNLHLIGEVPSSHHLRRVGRLDTTRVVSSTLESLLEDAPGGARRYQSVIAALPPRSAASMSNIARLAILHRSGGIYLDTDVLVLRPLHDPHDVGDYVGREAVWSAHRRWVESGGDVSTAARSIPWAMVRVAHRADSRCFGGRLRLADRIPEPASRPQINNAVVAARPRSEFLVAAFERVVAVDATKRFALGPSLLDDLVSDRPRLAAVLPSSRFYAVPPGQSYRYFEDRRLEMPVDAQVMHYVASNHRRLLARLGEDDPRFESMHAPFWVHGQHVRAQLDVTPRRRLRPVR